MGGTNIASSPNRNEEPKPFRLGLGRFLFMRIEEEALSFDNKAL